MNGNYYGRIVKLLIELKNSHPNYNMGKHLATCLDDVEAKHLWGMSDKELHSNLRKYQLSMQMDFPHDDSEIDKILKDGMKLSNAYELNDEDNNEY